MYNITFELKERLGIFEETRICNTHGTLDAILSYLIENKSNFGNYEKLKISFEARSTDVITK